MGADKGCVPAACGGPLGEGGAEASPLVLGINSANPNHAKAWGGGYPPFADHTPPTQILVAPRCPLSPPFAPPILTFGFPLGFLLPPRGLFLHQVLQDLLPSAPGALQICK